MKILIIGSGGREHSLAIKLKQSRHKPDLFIAPGNPGTAELGTNLNIKENQYNELLSFAKKEKISLCIVGPEQPLVDGVVDMFNKENIPIIGPNKIGAQLEGSKKWAKDKMIKYNIPTSKYEVFNKFDNADQYLKKQNTYPIVIKADGLAAGKGVTIAHSYEEGRRALNECLNQNKFANAGLEVVIEDFLIGEEASIFAFTDGKTILPMSAAQDHKAVFDEDKGPNTGGMGAYSPAPIVTKEIEKKVYDQVFKRLIDGFNKDGITYKGIVYAGLMIHPNGDPYIVEFNARFGDPETQIVLPRLKNDLVDIFLALHNEKLDEIKLEWEDTSSVCIVLASGGYPGDYKKGIKIDGVNSNQDNVTVIQAGTRLGINEQLETNGGRVLGVVATAKNLEEAIDLAYKKVNTIHFEGMHFRNDIGQKALKKAH